MNKTLLGVITFLVGGGVGTLIGYKIAEKKYMSKADKLIEELNEELENIKKSAEEYKKEAESSSSHRFSARPIIYSSPSEYLKGKKEKSEENFEDDISDKEMSDLVEDLGYSHAAEEEPNTPSIDKMIEDSEKTGPFVISPDDYGEFSDYDFQNLTYYAVDGYLVDDATDKPIEDIEMTTGWECLEHFDSDNAVYVRNNDLKTDFEIIRVNTSFYDD